MIVDKLNLGQYATSLGVELWIPLFRYLLGNLDYNFPVGMALIQPLKRPLIVL